MLDMNERRGGESSLGGGLANKGFLKEVTQLSLLSPRWRMHSSHTGQEKENMFRSLSDSVAGAHGARVW